MKKKIIALSVAAALLIIAVIGGTYAYLKDTDVQENTFVVGDVAIDLFEDFNSDNLQLIPAVGVRDPQTGVTTMNNTIEKEAYVENTGTTNAFVRLHIAVPALTKDGNNINAIATTFDDQTTVNGKWIWGKTTDSNYPPRDGGEWNIYRDIEIDGVPYKVFVVTYESVLAPGETTPDAINKVYMDPQVEETDIAAWDATYGDDEWAKVYVVAEAVQADGFTDAVAALNEAFGIPGTYDVDFEAIAEGKTIVDLD